MDSPPSGPPPGDDDPLLDAYSRSVAGAIARVAPSVVGIATVGGRWDGIAGSGFAYASRGLVVTNAHVVPDGRHVSVTLAGGGVRPARVVGHDPHRDIAVLAITGEVPPPAPLADRGSVLIGQVAIALGSPLGFAASAAAGIVSATGRRLALPAGGALSDLLQTDAAILPGNSGGPLVDSRGRVIGMCTAALRPGIGFAIAIDAVLDAVACLHREWDEDGGEIGCSGPCVRLERELAAALGLAGEYGVRVLWMQPAGPAAGAGLIEGDLVVAVDGRPVAEAGGLRRLLRRASPGAEVVVTTVRARRRRDVRVQLGQRGRRD